MFLIQPIMVVHTSLGKMSFPALLGHTDSKEKAILTPNFSSESTASIRFSIVMELKLHFRRLLEIQAFLQFFLSAVLSWSARSFLKLSPIKDCKELFKWMPKRHCRGKRDFCIQYHSCLIFFIKSEMTKWLF